MKLRIELNKKEIDAMASVKEAYSEFKTKFFDLPIVAESNKGFHVNSWLNGHGYTYSVTVPSWVICEYTRLVIKYKGRAIILANIVNSFKDLLNEWADDIRKEVSEIKNRHHM